MLDELWAAQHLTPAGPAEFQPGNLEAKFVAPPFTVLDTRQGYWQDRRRAWLSLGIKSELGRGADLLSLSPAEGARARWSEALPASTTGHGMAAQVGAGVAATTARRKAMERQMQPGYREQAALRSGEGRALEPGKGNARTDFGAYATNEAEGAEGGTSIFDPVLCELMYRWFAPEAGLILDPFAGGSVRGVVAAKLGHPYTGIDLSLAQLEANRRQAAAILAPTEPQPSWLHGDSRTLEDLLPAGTLYDMVMTCPPYFDLEVYSDDPADLSNAGEYSAFLDGYAEVIHRAAQRLRPERFAVLVVSEIRDPAGYCRGLVADTVKAAEVAGLRLYNEAVLVNSAGSLPLRVTKYMESSRKLGRAHQNVLCFLKGKPPRGWSYDRAAPPSPQLALELDLLQVPAEVASAGQAATMVALALLGEHPDAVVVAGTGQAEAIYNAARAVVEALPSPPALAATVPDEAEAAPAGAAHTPDQPGASEGVSTCEDHEPGHHATQAEADVCSAETYGEPADPRGIHLDQLEDGRWVDTATGELFDDDEHGNPGDPVRPLVAPAPPVATLDARQPITDLYEWACAGCGSAPEGALTSTVLVGMARGECTNCGREKVFRRAR